MLTTRAAASSTSTPLRSSRAKPKRAGAFTHVEFIYTPVKTKFDRAFNGLSPPRLYGEHRTKRKRVDDLDTTRLVDRFQTG